MVARSIVFHIHKKIWFILGLLLLVLLAPKTEVLLAAGINSIRVMEQARVDDDQILLGQIAQIDGDDPQRVLQVENIVIGKAPLPGSSRHITANYLAIRLKQNGIDLVAPQLKIPQEIEISRAAVEVDQDKIKQIINSFLYKHFSEKKESAQIKEIRVTDSVTLAKGRITYKVVPPPNSALLGQIPICVEFMVDGRLQKKAWTTVTIEMLAEVVVTKTPLGRYKPISEDDIELQQMDLADLPSNVITDPEAVIGKRSKRALQAGTVLRTDLIELPPLVNRGDMVVIVAETDGLKITALGEVKKRGRLGERIPVINFDSKKILYARVIDSNTVKVDF